MYQLRTYTLRSAEALHEYATVHWTRHVPSLRAFGVTTHGIWTDHDTGRYRLVALIAYPDGADPAELTAAFMASPEFAADMRGFDVGDIVDVQEVLLDATAASPLS
ncbi:NIPSNAP family protein [Lentzea sp. NPDC059081]|uniref:NIPSNAP family protein n=1 Tax=Lentzea sp. NPDC059081 TaxID=3346719 RepID=UPI0036AD7318